MVRENACCNPKHECSPHWSVIFAILARLRFEEDHAKQQLKTESWSGDTQNQLYVDVIPVTLGLAGRQHPDQFAPPSL